MVARDELPACSLNVGDRVNECEDRLRRTTLDIRAQTGECVEVDGGIYEQSL